MHHFHYQNGELHCEQVPLRRLAEQVGTPCYVYSHATLRHHFTVFDQSFTGVPHLICYSVKAGSNLALLRLFGSLGGGVDIVSGGELFRALRAGIPASRVVYSGVGKTNQEIEYALREDILMFNIESRQELDRINIEAGRIGCRARIGLRINPDVDARTHPYITTGLKKHKFGVDTEQAVDEYRRAQRLENIEIIGVACHIGSQLTEVSPFVDALKRLRVLIERLRDEHIDISYLDLGGGLGITYDREQPPHPRDYAEAILEHFDGLGCTLIFEPGRVIVGNAGIFLTRALYTKTTSDKRFVIVDGAMNDLIRPSLYGAHHHIQPVVQQERPLQTVDVVGPICETGDFLARDRELTQTRPGELLAVMSAGAYCFSMASNYNSRPRPPEILVKDDRHCVIRERETMEDMIRGEAIPEFLSG